MLYFFVKKIINDSVEWKTNLKLGPKSHIFLNDEPYTLSRNHRIWDFTRVSNAKNTNKAPSLKYVSRGIEQ